MQLIIINNNARRVCLGDCLQLQVVVDFQKMLDIPPYSDNYWDAYKKDAMGDAYKKDAMFFSIVEMTNSHQLICSEYS